MQYNEIQLQEFRRQFSLRRKRQFLLAIPFIVVFLTLLTLDDKTELVFGVIPVTAFAYIAMAVFVGAGIFSFKNWRCPACDKYLGKSFLIDFCPKCGVPLK